MDSITPRATDSESWKSLLRSKRRIRRSNGKGRGRSDIRRPFSELLERRQKRIHMQEGFGLLQCPEYRLLFRNIVAISI